MYREAIRDQAGHAGGFTKAKPPAARTLGLPKKR
jgi:hypothetical protein